MERLIKVGDVKAIASKDVKNSRVGIGFEKLDRDVFDPENAYDPVAATGVKWVRIQSGWERTEKERGVYSFEWLDSIVDNLLKRGLVPWMCLCYGNPLYSERAKTVFGSVGCAPIFTEEERIAWDNYVKAVVEHYRGRIQYYEVWNEPDGVWCWKHGPSGTEYGEFMIRTSKAVKSVDPEAKIIGGCQCMGSMRWVGEVFGTGAGKYMDAYSFHTYIPYELMNHDYLRGLRAFIKRDNPAIELIQGETGAQSRWGGAGAMSGAAWTERKQAKFMARHFMSDFMADVKFSSYFSSLDMVEALNGTKDDLNSHKDFGYFGVLRAEFDENGKATGVYTPKPSYRTLQVIASVFREDFTVEDFPLTHADGGYTGISPRMMAKEATCDQIARVCFKRSNGSMAMAYWRSLDLMTTDYEGTHSFQGYDLPGPCRLIDLYDGAIYEIPDSIMQKEGNFTRFLHLPIRDYPLLLTFGDFLLD